MESRQRQKLILKSQCKHLSSRNYAYLRVIVGRILYLRSPGTQRPTSAHTHTYRARDNGSALVEL